jgi:hypothetical protein
MSVVARFRALAPTLSRARSLAGVVALAVGVVGCASDATTSGSASLVATNDGDASSQPGWLLLDWSIAGDSHAEQCDLSHSATIAITVGSAGGESRRVHQATCMAFNATIQLSPGDYIADAVLLDGAGESLTVPVALQPFEISSGLPLRVPLEFPLNAFKAR